ncbi:MAG: MarR family winged helix-turn-helix transcriptional regulator [Pseudomonadota bacterium]
MSKEAPDSSVPPPRDDAAMVFQLFNEVGIISQLSSAMFNKRLPQGLHVSHFSVLNHMVRLGDGQTPVQLAGAFQVTKATMTHTLTVLSKGGFVRLEPNPADARSKLVFITDAGTELRNQSIAALAEPTRELIKLLNVEELREAVPVLERLRRTLDENREL